MDDRTIARGQALRQLMESLDYQDFRNWMGHGHESPFVVAVPEDTVSDTLSRLRKRYGGAGRVLVVDGGGIFSMIEMCHVKAESAPEVTDVQDVHSESSMGMLVTFLKTQRSPVRIRPVAPDLTMQVCGSDGGGDIADFVDV